MRKQLFNGLLLGSLITLFLFSCKPKDSNEQIGEPYDPNKPVTLTRFYPDSGGMATKVILEGTNFGINNKAVKVYFNYKEEDTGNIRSKRAAVVASVGDMIYAITPRQPGNGSATGDTCFISVVVGKDSVVYKKHFIYHTTTTVSTIAGVPQTADKDRTGGTLSTARFSIPKYLASDREGNVYLVDWQNDWNAPSTFYLINQNADRVQAIGSIGRSNAPCLDPTGQFLLVPADAGVDCYLFNIGLEFEQTTIKPRKVDLTSWQYKLSLAPSKLDGLIYTVVSSAGNSKPYIMAINRQQNTIQMVADITTDQAHSFLAFDPTNPEWLYIAQSQLHMISRYNIVTKVYESGWAGSKAEGGHLDGPRTVARFNFPRQISFDSNGHLYIADVNNHCIRKITPDGLVTTVIGQPGIAGYIDGGPDDALFRNPEGVTVTPDDAVWVSDTGNDVLRKLAIE
ncbi:IPT/TIG domain-containing protein [Paludibacter sp.]